MKRQVQAFKTSEEAHRFADGFPEEAEALVFKTTRKTVMDEGQTVDEPEETLWYHVAYNQKEDA